MTYLLIGLSVAYVGCIFVVLSFCKAAKDADEMVDRAEREGRENREHK